MENESTAPNTLAAARATILALPIPVDLRSCNPTPSVVWRAALEAAADALAQSEGAPNIAIGERSALAPLAFDAPAENAAFRDWAWNKPGMPIGRLHGSEAAHDGWMARAKLSATPAPLSREPEQDAAGFARQYSREYPGASLDQALKAWDEHCAKRSESAGVPQPYYPAVYRPMSADEQVALDFYSANPSAALADLQARLKAPLT